MWLFAVVTAAALVHRISRSVRRESVAVSDATRQCIIATVEHKKRCIGKFKRNIYSSLNCKK
jgi:hypothetical protein